MSFVIKSVFIVINIYIIYLVIPFITILQMHLESEITES